MIDNKDAAARAVLTGKMWSDPVRREVISGQLFSRQTAAFVFGADEHQALSPAEMMVVALAGRAVSPVTSYVAAEPGTRPSTIGLEEGVIGTSRYGTIGHGSGGGSGSGISPPDLESLIDTSACVQRIHPRSAWKVTLDVETTKDEIVDVRSTTAGALADCLVETAWATRLDDHFLLERQQFTIAFSGPAEP